MKLPTQVAIKALAAIDSNLRNYLQYLWQEIQQAVNINFRDITRVAVAFAGVSVVTVTITDARVVASTTGILISAEQPTDPATYMYLVNVVKIQQGSFDITVLCLNNNVSPLTVHAPTETMYVHYEIYNLGT